MKIVFSNFLFSPFAKFVALEKVLYGITCLSPTQTNQSLLYSICIQQLQYLICETLSN